MPTLALLNQEGKKVGDITLNDAVFGIEPNTQVLYDVVNAQRAAMRQGTHSVKTRAEVSGGGRKPWKQKGTGRARQGSIRAPHMVGGGVTFGPQPRSFEKKVNKKVRKLALISALSEKVKEGNLVVIDGAFDAPKTKQAVSLVNALNAAKKQLFVVNDLTVDADWNLYLSARNILGAIVLQPNELGVYWLLKQEKVIVTKEALKAIEEVLA